MDNYIDELIKDIPEALRPLTLMEGANDPILIHDGNFELSARGLNYLCFGRIDFQWLPSKHIRFSATTDSSVQLVHEQRANTIFEVIIQDRALFKGLLSGNSINIISSKMSISGQLYPGIITGDKEPLVDFVRFEVANLKSLFGCPVKTGRHISKSRLVFENDQYVIVIDKLPDFDARYEELKQEGGFILTHTGSLMKKGVRISYHETEIVIHNLKYFLSFVNGTRTSPVFIKGILTDEVAWTSYDLREIDQYKSVWSWALNLHTDGLSGLWEGFLLQLEVAPYTWLKTSLHWYLEANRQSGYAEGSIVMVQCALELLYNRLLENGEIPSPKTNESQSAATNIRKLLNYYSLSTNIPSHHVNSRNYSNGEHDGPGMLVLLRNALVHSKETKREKLKDITPQVIAEVLHLGIFYVEIVLLKSLGYKGAAFNRSEEVLFSGPFEDQP